MFNDMCRSLPLGVVLSQLESSFGICFSGFGQCSDWPFHTYGALIFALRIALCPGGVQNREVILTRDVTGRA